MTEEQRGVEGILEYWKHPKRLFSRAGEELGH